MRFVSAVMVVMICGVALGQTPQDQGRLLKEESCTVSLVVDAAGHPSDIHVLHCTDPRASEPAAKSVAESTYRPAMLRGKPVAMRMTITVKVKHLKAPG